MINQKQKNIISPENKQLDLLIETIADACENDMDYYLGHSREEMMKNIYEHLEDFYSMIEIKTK